MNIFSLPPFIPRLVDVVKIHPAHARSFHTNISSIIYFTFQLSIPHGNLAIGSSFLFFSFSVHQIMGKLHYEHDRCRGLGDSCGNLEGVITSSSGSLITHNTSGSYYRHLVDKYRKHVSLNCVKPITYKLRNLQRRRDAIFVY
jgi:hypothetical protein